MQPRPRHWPHLLIGASLLVASQLRFGVPLLAWLMPAAWLAWLRATDGWRSRLLFVMAFVLAWHAAILKIVTPPLTFAAVPAFAIPIGLVHALPYLAWSALRARLPSWQGPPLFAAGVVLCEWLLHAALPFGTWGSLANTQADELPLLQLASVTGAHGVSFLLAWASAAAEHWWAARAGAETLVARRQAVAAIIAVLSTIAAGQARLATAALDGGTVRVAAVGTDATFAGLPLPSVAERAAIDAALWARTRVAARAGAQLVVWPEAATLVGKEDEPRWQKAAQQLARDERITLAAAYVVPASIAPLLYENKYILLSSQGELLYTYLKHRPVPGEPALRGQGPLPLVTLPELGRVSGAICYDYDFPRLALQHAQADLVVLPSSDWRGIHPLHTSMARMRAIETGAALVRATRFGLSAAFDPHGRVRSAVSHVSDGRGLLLAELPQHRVTTVYGLLGDWFPLTCALFFAIGLATAIAARAHRG